MAVVGWLIALVAGIGLALFSVNNQQAVSINLVGAVYESVPVWLIVLGAGALGALIVILISLVDRLRWFVSERHGKKVLAEHKRMIIERDNRIHELEQEIFRLRGAA
jgi:uncharacterized integral membrane protein